MTNEEKQEMRNLMAVWVTRADIYETAHYHSSTYYEKFFLFLGASVIVLSAFIGSAEVLIPSAKIADIGPEIVKASSGIISLFIAILAGLQTFLKFSQRSELHRSAGAKYGDIKRSLEEAIIHMCNAKNDSITELHHIKETFDHVANEVPTLPQHILKKVELNLS